MAAVYRQPATPGAVMSRRSYNPARTEVTGIRSLRELFIVGAGGFIGAVGRYWLSGWVHRWAGAGFPWGTLTVNLAGCLLLGAVTSLGESRLALSPEARTFVAIGVLGSFTTFSTLSYETIELVRQWQLVSALANAAGSLVLGLAALVAGRALIGGMLH